MKSFSTLRDNQWGSQIYMEKRRGRRELEVTRRRRGGVKRIETYLASNQFPKCSPQPSTTKEFHRLGREQKGREQKGEEGDRGGLLSKRMSCLSGCLVSSASVQKLFSRICSAFKWSFDEFVGKRVVSPFYSSTILRPLPSILICSEI